MAKLPVQGEENYLGDGLFVSFDGFQIILRAPRDTGDHFVAIEPVVWQKLLCWIDKFPLLATYMKGKLR